MKVFIEEHKIERRSVELQNGDIVTWNAIGPYEIARELSAKGVPAQIIRLADKRVEVYVSVKHTKKYLRAAEEIENECRSEGSELNLRSLVYYKKKNALMNFDCSSIRASIEDIEEHETRDYIGFPPTRHYCFGNGKKVK